MCVGLRNAGEMRQSCLVKSRGERRSNVDRREISSPPSLHQTALLLSMTVERKDKHRFTVCRWDRGLDSSCGDGVGVREKVKGEMLRLAKCEPRRPCTQAWRNGLQQRQTEQTNLCSWIAPPRLRRHSQTFIRSGICYCPTSSELRRKAV